MNSTQLLNKRQIFVVKVWSERVKVIEVPIQCLEGILSMARLTLMIRNSPCVTVTTAQPQSLPLEGCPGNKNANPSSYGLGAMACC